MLSRTQSKKGLSRGYFIYFFVITKLNLRKNIPTIKKNEITKKNIEGIIFRKYDSVITKKMLKEKFFISTIPLLRKNRWNALKLLSKTRERHFDTWVMFLVCAECIFHKREKNSQKMHLWEKFLFSAKWTKKYARILHR